MIHRIGIKNFQSIETLAVECGPITVFVGESDSGKSAVVRALYAAAFNDYPSDHVREGETDSSVGVMIGDTLIRAEKGKTKNGYRMTEAGGAEKSWDRVGREVPDEVAKALGWRVLELDDGTKFAPSIQRQFDGPFLLADSPSRVAKVLGSLTNISTLFAAIREGTNEERRYRQSADAAKEEASRHEADAGLSAEERDSVEARAQRAREQLEVVEHDQAALESVASILEALEVSRKSVGQLEQMLEETKAKAIEVPDLEDQFRELHDLDVLEVALAHESKKVSEAMTGLQQAQAGFEEHQGRFEAYMEGLEVCPVCERSMHDYDLDGAHPFTEESNQI